MRPIGVFGGTFDPIHFGHILPVLDVCERTGLSEVRFIPNARPGHRSRPSADAIHRWEMAKLALAEHPNLIADYREIRRPGTSYTVPTLRQMRSEFGLRPLCLILGLDAFLQMQQWYWWAEVMRLANIIVMARPGARQPNRYPTWVLRGLNSHPRVLFERMAGNICFVSVSQLDISATQLRKLIKRGEDINKFLPKKVAQYIADHTLYTDGR